MDSEKDRPKAAGECGPCSPLRNRYFRGKLLTVADYEAEQLYMIRRRRLVNRAVLGWGVISGFTVSSKDGCLDIGMGVAFDAKGRELVACDGVSLCAPEDVFWLKHGACGCGETVTPATGRYLLSAHYAERRVDGVRVDDGCGQTSCEWNHVCETVVFVLTPQEECPCGRPGCHGRDDPFDCSALVPDDQAPSAPSVLNADEHAAAVDDRGPHATLCEWSSDWLEGHDPCDKAGLCVQNGYWIDPCAGVPLACITVGTGDCEKLIFELEQDCQPRRLVRPNDMLFDLIRGCDLTRIKTVGWDDTAGEMTRYDFSDLFVTPPEPPALPSSTPAPMQTTQSRPSRQQREQRRSEPVKHPPVDTYFTVCFTAPVQIASLTPDVITMALVQRHPNERLGVVYRVPIEALWILPRQADDPPDTTRGFRPMVAWQFWDGEINNDAVSGFDRPTLVEIEIRGDFILDWRGQAVDANRIGRHRWPTGNGTPGGAFLSSFLVQDPQNPPPGQPAVTDGTDAATLST